MTAPGCLALQNLCRAYRHVAALTCTDLAVRSACSPTTGAPCRSRAQVIPKCSSSSTYSLRAAVSDAHADKDNFNLPPALAGRVWKYLSAIRVAPASEKLDAWTRTAQLIAGLTGPEFPKETQLLECGRWWTPMRLSVLTTPTFCKPDWLKVSATQFILTMMLGHQSSAMKRSRCVSPNCTRRSALCRCLVKMADLGRCALAI